MKKLLIILLLISSLISRGATYYIKTGGNDGLAGTSDATAWATLSKVNGITFQPGDSILFKRGNTFRGSIYQTENGNSSNWIVYGAYGTGTKPKILGSKDISLNADWTNHYGNVWKTSAQLGTIQNDISNLIFNNEAFAGYKKKSIDSLNAQGKFWYNTLDKLLYIYSTSNPGTFYTHIEAAGHHDLRQGLLSWRNSSYIKIENLDARYSSAAGIETDGCNHITIDRCGLSWIGGEWLFGTGSDLRRLGNGYSFILNNDYIIVSNSTAHECYDAGISPQSWVDNTVQTNMSFYDNIITNCYYSYETWCATTYTLTNIHYYNNTSISPGDCWSNTVRQRPDYLNSCHVMIWALTGTATNVTILNNIFSGSCNVAMRLDDNVNKLTVDYNLFNTTRVGYTNESTYYTTLAAWQAAMSQDAHSISADPAFISTSDFRLQSGSPAIDAGTNTGLSIDFDGNARPDNGVYDIGAFEFQSPVAPSASGFGRVGTKFGKYGSKFVKISEL